MRAVKNLITKKFWHSVSLVLVAIYRSEFRLSLFLSLPPLFSFLSSAPFPLLGISSLAVRSILSLFLPLEGGNPPARVSAVYSSPPRTAHRSFPLRLASVAASPLAAHAFYKAPLYNILLIMRSRESTGIPATAAARVSKAAVVNGGASRT